MSYYQSSSGLAYVYHWGCIRMRLGLYTYATRFVYVCDWVCIRLLTHVRVLDYDMAHHVNVEVRSHVYECLIISLPLGLYT